MPPPMLSSKKRSLPGPDKQHGRHKRIKKAAPAKPGRSVRLDELSWKEVSMPDRLADVEGFYGLEEVDDVDVVRGEGKINFVQVSTNPQKLGSGDRPQVGKENASAKDESGTIGDASQEEEEDGDADEWHGIEDSKDGSGEHIVKNTRAPSLAPSKPSTKHVSTIDDSLLHGDFLALVDETPEEDVALPAWTALGLSLSTLRALARLNFTTPTPIQSAAIPLILSKHSVIGKASTGSGKTLAFGIPILEKYLDSLPTTDLPAPNGPQKAVHKNDTKLTALIIAPTRELAHQITKHLTDLCYYTDLKIVTLTGGLSVQKQQRLLDSGVDVIVATPGRLWEVVSEGQGWIDRLRKVKFLVLDEADRVLEEGHFKEVEQLLTLMDAENGDSSDEEEDEEDVKAKFIGNEDVNKKAKRKRAKQRNSATNGKKNTYAKQRQTLVFSATFHKGLQQKLAGKNSKRSWANGDLLSDSESMEYLLKKLRFGEMPEWVDVNPVDTIAEKVKEGIVECGAMEKDLYLYYLLLRYPYRTLIFTNSISSVRRLVPFLNHLLPPITQKVYPLHSQMPQKSRLRSLERFSSPSSPSHILVSTDVAARGIDIRNVEMVVHYHLPRAADMYVHRSGRTGRGDEEVGVSILLCAPGEAAAMARLAGKVHVSSSTTSATKGSYIRSLDIDRNLLSHIKRRVELAKLISDTESTNQRAGKEQDWLRTAADELGVDISDNELAAISSSSKRNNKFKNKGRSKGGRGSEWDDGAEDGDDAGSGKGKGAGAGKDQINKWKWELKQELERKVNKGFSTRYLTAGVGGLNLADHLLAGKGHAGILGEEKRRVVDELM